MYVLDKLLPNPEMDQRTKPNDFGNDAFFRGPWCVLEFKYRGSSICEAPNCHIEAVWQRLQFPANESLRYAQPRQSKLANGAFSPQGTVRYWGAAVDILGLSFARFICAINHHVHTSWDKRYSQFT